MITLSACVCLIGQVANGQVHQPYQSPLTAKKIRTAIDDAVTYLRNHQRPDGSILESGTQGGATSLAALAMLAAGANPASDKQMQMALDWLGNIEPNNTYVRGIRANVWEYALRKVPYEKKYRDLLKQDFDWLIAAQNGTPGWRYTFSSKDWDNSCTQYGVLGIWAASRAGFDAGDDFWKRMSEHFRGCQRPDGGWGYTGSSGSTANMATAGLASMFLVFDKYHAQAVYQRDQPNVFEEGAAAEVLKSLDRGMEWLGKRGGENGGYYFYGVERTGATSGRKYIGGRDWFAEHAEFILQRQRTDGSIPLCRWGHQYGTSLCTLFLVHGGAPVAFNKLEYGEGQNWNLNPRDLANLTKELWSAYERPLNWQTVSLSRPVEEFEAPVLFISGSKAVSFNEEETLKLRDYVLRGGTILAEASDHSEEFSESIGKLLENMFDPREYPSHQLRDVKPDHPLFTVIRQEWKSQPKIRAASNGSREFLILSDEYMSADWQRNNTDSDSFKLAMNILFYATDLGELRPKFSTTIPETPAHPAKAATVRVARGIFKGANASPRDWDAGTRSWTSFAPYVKHVLGITIEEVQPLKLTDEKLSEVQLLHLTGRHSFKLSAKQQTALQEYVAGGGSVLIDAYSGSASFAEAAEREMKKVFPDLVPLASDDVVAEGLFDGGVDLSKCRFSLTARKELRHADASTRGQKLLVAKDDGRAAVIFSRFDLSAGISNVRNYRSLSYRADSARDIVANFVAYIAAD